MITLVNVLLFKSVNIIFSFPIINNSKKKKDPMFMILILLVLGRLKSCINPYAFAGKISHFKVGWGEECCYSTMQQNSTRNGETSFNPYTFSLVQAFKAFYSGCKMGRLCNGSHWVLVKMGIFIIQVWLGWVDPSTHLLSSLLEFSNLLTKIIKQYILLNNNLIFQ